MNRLKDFASRVEVRLGELAVTLSLALPEILDQLGVIDLHPLSYIFGEQRTAVMITILTLVLAVMRPIVHVRPRQCG